VGCGHVTGTGVTGSGVTGSVTGSGVTGWGRPWTGSAGSPVDSRGSAPRSSGGHTGSPSRPAAAQLVRASSLTAVTSPEAA
jgi:hypothetical protein